MGHDCLAPLISERDYTRGMACRGVHEDLYHQSRSGWSYAVVCDGDQKRAREYPLLEMNGDLHTYTYTRTHMYTGYTLSCKTGTVGLPAHSPAHMAPG
jgi:hypothetical protein